MILGFLKGIFSDDTKIEFCHETESCRFIDYYNFVKLDKPKTRLEGHTMERPDGVIVRMWKYQNKGLMVVRNQKSLKRMKDDPDFNFITKQ